MPKKQKEWDRAWTHTYNNLSVDFEKLHKQLKQYLQKRNYKIRTDTQPSNTGFTLMGEKTSLLKLRKQPQLAVEIKGNPDNFECAVYANEGEKFDLEASKWNLKVTETIQQLKNTNKTQTNNATRHQQANPTQTLPTEDKLAKTTLKKPILLKRKYYRQLSGIILQLLEDQEDKEAVMLRTIQTQLRTKAPNVEASTTDIEKALHTLERSGLILGVKTLPGGLKIVQLTPLELKEELTTILKLTENQQYTTIEEIARKTGWPVAKAQQALNRLEKLGITRKVENYKTGTKYYFP